MKNVGLLLIVIGAVLLIWTGFTYTKKEKIIDAGPIEISADREKSVNWSPYAGACLFDELSYYDNPGPAFGALMYI